LQNSKKSSTGPVAKNVPLSFFIADQLYVALLPPVTLIIITPLPFIPIFGNLVYFCVICLLYSYYCFGYSGQCSPSKLSRNWVYFMGFGTPLTLLTWFGPVYISLAVYAVLFPIFFITAHYSHPICQSSENTLVPLRVDIFHQAGFVVTRILEFLIKNTNQIARFLKALGGDNTSSNTNGNNNTSSNTNGNNNTSNNKNNNDNNKNNGTNTSYPDANTTLKKE